MNDDKTRLRLKSDGTATGTYLVIVHEDGTEEPIPTALAFRLTAVDWHADALNGLSSCTLHLEDVEAEADALVTLPAP